MPKATSQNIITDERKRTPTGAINPEEARAHVEDLDGLMTKYLKEG